MAEIRSIVIFFLVFSIYAIESAAFGIGVSPSELPITDDETKQFVIVNPNDFAIEFLIQGGTDGLDLIYQNNTILPKGKTIVDIRLGKEDKDIINISREVIIEAKSDSIQVIPSVTIHITGKRTGLKTEPEPEGFVFEDSSADTDLQRNPLIIEDDTKSIGWAVYPISGVSLLLLIAAVAVIAFIVVRKLKRPI